MRPNWERLDQAYAGAIIVNPDTIPDESVLYDGCLVAERSTGIVWRAQKNASGVFEKRYIKYPWRISFYNQTNQSPTGITNWALFGYSTVEGGTINAGAESLVGGRAIIPVTGYYQGGDWVKWNTPQTASHRGHTLWVNNETTASPNSPQDGEQSRPCVFNGGSTSCVKINRKFYKGDSVCAGLWHAEAVGITVDHRIQLALVRVVG
jgi:hypothetical protein